MEFFNPNNLSNNICILTSSHLAVKWHISPHLNNLSKYSNITILTSNIKYLDYKDLKNISLVELNINNKISPLNDILLTFKLYNFIKKNNFHGIITMTPKAGLLGMLASFIALTEVRIHIFTGQVWYNKTGFIRKFLILCDRLISSLSTNVIIDSKSQFNLLLDYNIINSKKSTVIGSGSVVGVNLVRFKQDFINRVSDRNFYKINDLTVLFLYLGRINIDKGIFDLLNAFISYSSSSNYMDSQLLIVGPLELSESDTSLFHALINQSDVIYLPYTDYPEKYMNMSDVLFLPSYREGFGNVIVESAAMGIPSVASDISGISDSVVNGVTGILHKPGSVNEISDAMVLMSTNSNLRQSMGVNAKSRVHDHFSQQQVLNSYLEYYKSINLFPKYSI